MYDYFAHKDNNNMIKGIINTKKMEHYKKNWGYSSVFKLWLQPQKLPI